MHLAHHMIQNNQLGEGKGVALSQGVANVEKAELVEAVGAEVAGVLHMRPDTIFEFTGFLMADIAVDLQYIADFTAIDLFS